MRFQYALRRLGHLDGRLHRHAATPYTCTFNTIGVADGLYDLRALATDNAGNTTASTVQTNRRIDNHGPVVAITSPAPASRPRHDHGRGRGDRPGVGVTSVTFEYRQGAGAWAAICTDTTATYTCTARLDAGRRRHLRAPHVGDRHPRPHDDLGADALTIDNTRPTATNVQARQRRHRRAASNAGDTMTFTWSEAMAPASIMTGWDGSLRSHGHPRAGRPTTAAATRSTSTTRRHARLEHHRRRWAAAERQLRHDRRVVQRHDERMARATRVTVTIGSLISGACIDPSPTSRHADMKWTSSTAATDVAGNTATGNNVTETGTTTATSSAPRSQPGAGWTPRVLGYCRSVR